MHVDVSFAFQDKEVVLRKKEYLQDTPTCLKSFTLSDRSKSVLVLRKQLSGDARSRG